MIFFFSTQVDVNKANESGRMGNITQEEKIIIQHSALIEFYIFPHDKKSVIYSEAREL